MHQRERRGIAHGEPVDVGDRQREARALQQGAGVAQIGERRDARRDAVLDLGLGRGEGLAQLDQGVAADERGEEQPVRLERAPDLHQRARQIVDELQRERGDHEIERGVAERQRFLVGGNRQSGTHGTRAGERIGGDDRADLAARGEHAAYGVGRRAEIDGEIEVPQHRRETLGDILGNAIDQKGRRRARGGAGAARAQEPTVEHVTMCGLGICHAGILSRATRDLH